MRIKLLVILFIGLCSNFAGAIKAEELEICNYSKPAEFASCKKKNMTFKFILNFYNYFFMYQ